MIRSKPRSQVQRAANGWIEGVAILVAVFIVLAVSSGNDYQKDLQFKKLLTPPPPNVHPNAAPHLETGPRALDRQKPRTTDPVQYLPVVALA
jgi:hypothetical protein